MLSFNSLNLEEENEVLIIYINRPFRKNAVDSACAKELRKAFRFFESSNNYKISVLTSVGDSFCSGADLKALTEGDKRPVNGKIGPMGPTLDTLSKPVICAIEGYAVAGGLELALWCDLRVAAESAILGVFCRRFGVPLVDGGTVRLARLIGLSRALDLIMTGRPVTANEAYSMGLVNYLSKNGKALERAVELAKEIAKFPQTCMNHDRLSAIESFGLPLKEALYNEAMHGRKVISSGETLQGASEFYKGNGRHAKFE